MRKIIFGLILALIVVSGIALVSASDVDGTTTDGPSIYCPGFEGPHPADNPGGLPYTVEVFAFDHDAVSSDDGGKIYE